MSAGMNCLWTLPLSQITHIHTTEIPIYTFKDQNQCRSMCLRCSRDKQTVRTCEVVEDPGTLSGQGRLGLQVGLKKCTQSNHDTNVAHFSAQFFHWAGGQEVSYAPQHRTDELERKNTMKMSVKIPYCLFCIPQPKDAYLTQLQIFLSMVYHKFD